MPEIPFAHINLRILFKMVRLFALYYEKKKGKKKRKKKRKIIINQLHCLRVYRSSSPIEPSFIIENKENRSDCC